MMNIFPNSMEKLRDDTAGDKVDIITRTKDRPILLARGLQSIIAQTHTNWHLYVVNDGGDAEPVNRMVEDQRAALGNRVTVIHHPTSLGVSGAANAGFRIGTSDFVAIHDDDDTWTPDFLRIATSFLTSPQNRRFGGLLSKWNVIDETLEGDRITTHGTSVAGYDGDVVDFLDVMRKPEVPPIASLWRRSVCKKAGYMNEDLAVLEDWDLHLRILQIADIANIAEPLVNYHIRRRATGESTYGNTITQSANTHLRYNKLYRNSLMREYLNQNPAQIGLVVNMLKNLEVVERLPGGGFGAFSPGTEGRCSQVRRTA